MGINKQLKPIKKGKAMQGRTVAERAGSGVSATLDYPQRGAVPATLDYPQRGEIINSPQYTFRAGTSADTERVEISINHWAWQECRQAAGYWWYDWTGYKDGNYNAVVRAYKKGGLVSTSEPTKFVVLLGAGLKR